MIEVISINEADPLDAKLRRIRERNVALDPGLMSQVTSIIDDVRRRGDAALIDCAERFDGVVMQPTDLRVSEKALREIALRVDQSVLEALREAIQRVREFHEHERPQSWEFESANGMRLGQRLTAIERAGVYVPGGSAAYPSSVVMSVVPAQVTGVDRIVVATPPRAIQEKPAVAAALIELNVTEVFAVGGAQAIAALAFGTETVPRVDKITGPGNRYVAAAKQQVFGVVGIDSIAGPSEVVIVADQTANALFVVADLLAQAEHGEDACALVLTDSEALATEVARQLTKQMAHLPRVRILEESLSRYGAIIVVNDLDEATKLVNELAPEHVQIIAANEDCIASRIRNAGAIFFGSYSPTAVGDYLAGPNHVLPTAGAARFSSGLSVHDFLKRTSTVRYSAAELKRTAPLIAALARAEGLEGHARSALMRFEEEVDL
jgi:histidinol dehydrogenase